eukprot:361851-Chlamydomonas_euryale.AAC.3
MGNSLQHANAALNLDLIYYDWPGQGRSRLVGAMQQSTAPPTPVPSAFGSIAGHGLEQSLCKSAKARPFLVARNFRLAAPRPSQRLIPLP